MKKWNATKAKQYFSEVIDSVVEEPQIVLRRGKPVGVFISYADFLQNASLTGEKSVSHWLSDLELICRVESDMDQVARADRIVPNWE